MFLINVGGLWAKALPMELGKKTIKAKGLKDGEAGDEFTFYRNFSGLSKL